jgi:hypothetical protein
MKTTTKILSKSQRRSLSRATLKKRLKISRQTANVYKKRGIAEWIHMILTNQAAIMEVLLQEFDRE